MSGTTINPCRGCVWAARAVGVQAGDSVLEVGIKGGKIETSLGSSSAEQETAQAEAVSWKRAGYVHGAEALGARSTQLENRGFRLCSLSQWAPYGLSLQGLGGLWGVWTSHLPSLGLSCLI